MVATIAHAKELEPITIRMPSGEQAAFVVSIANTSQKKIQGLMFIDYMNDQEGMIFPYPKPTIAKFWMKNTLIPLDILFFNNHNELVHIEHSAQPHDLTPVGPDVPICYVLEINGGLSKKYDIKVGSKLIENFAQECLHYPLKK